MPEIQYTSVPTESKGQGLKTVTDKSGKQRTAKAGYKFYPSAGGEYVELPESTDTSIYEKEASLLQDVSQKVMGQVSAAEKAVGTAQKAGDAARSAARRTAAMQLSGYRGMGESGRGMALGQEAAQVAGITEGNILAKTAAAVSEEQQTLAQARADAAVAQKKLLEQEKMWSQETVDAAGDIEAILKPLYDNTAYTSADEVAKARKALVTKMQAAITPKAKAAYQAAIDNIDSKGYDFGGVDTWKM